MDTKHHLPRLKITWVHQAIKPIFEKLDNRDVEKEIKTSIQEKLETMSSNGKIVIQGHVNAIKGIV